MSATIAHDMPPMVLIPKQASVVEVYESPGYEEGEGIAIDLVGEAMRVQVRLEGSEATAWCSIVNLLNAIETQTREIGN